MNLTYSVLCHSCGTAIDPNPATLCMNCLKNQTNLAEPVDAEQIIHFCRQCERFCTEQGKYVPAALESTQLLGICLKKIRGLKGLKIKDAAFLWTEPHSKRIKVRLTLQREIYNILIEQDHVCTFTQHVTMCDECQYTYTDHTWTYQVQLRQKTQHKRTFLYLEHEIVKNKDKLHFTDVIKQPEGIDFCFKQKSSCNKFIDFVHTRAPGIHHQSDKMVSADIKSNTAYIKHSVIFNLAIISKDDLVIVPKKLRPLIGHIGPVCIVYKVNQRIHLVDPLTGSTGSLTAAQYFSAQFSSVQSRKNRIKAYICETEEGGMSVQTDIDSELSEVHYCRSHIVNAKEDTFCWVYQADQIDFNSESELNRGFEVNQKYYIINRAQNVEKKRKQLKDECHDEEMGYQDDDYEAVAEMLDEDDQGELLEDEVLIEGNGYCPDIDE
ncbi:Nonsense-mediated mRNA decay protein 3 [Spironucleus salmonicida]|uniref:60S ribosomal export protein NMD3 n=1 Tax=Spironucleus salmonicida TaxID=348837 RepID=V6LVK3_9EUKA|nr:Nonsense-mediated mRNA decay protein 3 [Spironucleus salmonicida]|eukprot:EST44844.1 Nonsense-mediated mRNA decay protein 3 [Spironucleus salmonicida]